MSHIQVQSLSYTYPDGVKALHDISLEIPAGTRVALVGPNGSGKSTLLRHFNGLLQPTEGHIRFDGKPLQYDRAALRVLRQKVGLIFQEPEDQFFAATVRDDIAFGPLNLRFVRATVDQCVANAAADVGIIDLLDRPLHALSGGEKMRVAIAGVLAMSPTVILADEPLASLDSGLQTRLLALFERLAAEGRTILLATHDIDQAYSWCDSVIVLKAGRLLAHGDAHDVFSNATLLASCGWEPPWPIAIHQVLHLPGNAPRKRAELIANIKTSAVG